MFDVNWSTDSWRNLKADQQPPYDKDDLALVCSDLGRRDQIVKYSQVEHLMSEISEASIGNKLIIQAGDCAESFSDSSILNTHRSISMMEEFASIVFSKTGLDAIKIGRIAGQFAKPRSDGFETIDGLTLPSYRGDIANGFDFTSESRLCSAKRLITAYEISKEKFEVISKAPMDTPLFISHECLVIDYDSALVRNHVDRVYCSSAHLLWIGYRTGDIDGAHVEFLRGIENPIGIKVGSSTTKEYIARISEKLNPQNKPGKIVLIHRFGANRHQENLHRLLSGISSLGLKLCHLADPMHGNGYKNNDGIKTRKVDDIKLDIQYFIKACSENKINVGGLHLEATHGNVSECVGLNVEDSNLKTNYKSLCDPRLNFVQAKDVVNYFAEEYLKNKN